LGLCTASPKNHPPGQAVAGPNVAHEAQRAKELLWQLHEQNVNAYLVWSRNKKDGGTFRDREPESADRNEWTQISKFLST